MGITLENAKKKGKAFSKMNTEELLHLWCNKMIPKEITKGDYVFNPTEIWFIAAYRGNYKIAEHRDLPDTYRPDSSINIAKKESLIYIKQFNNKGSFGSGLNSYSIHKCIPLEILPIMCDNIPGKNISKDDMFLWMSSEFHKYCKHAYNGVAWFKETVSNGRMLSIPYAVLDELNYPSLRALAPELYNQIINTETTQEIEYKHYSGWGNSGDIRQKQKITFKPVDFKLETFFSEHEIEILKMKEWREKNDKVKTTDSLSYISSTKEITKIWFGDPEVKKRFIETREKLLADKKRADKLAELKKREGSVKKSLSFINAWRDRVSSFITLNLGYTCLRLTQDKKAIISSQGMTIYFEEAKKALRLYRIKETKTELIQGFKYHGIHKKTIPYLDETGEVAYRDEDCIICGCHSVPESEIKAFLEFYKLDW